MTINHHRKKQPERVRTTLIECAKSLATVSGLSTVSVLAVCNMAGVTKGAFFHHFQNKDALITCVFEQMLTDYSDEIIRLMTCDPCDVGAFTRAYIEQGIATMRNAELMTLWKSAMGDAAISKRWQEWFLCMLETRGNLEDRPGLAVARLAADGLCLGISMQTVPGDPGYIIAALRQLAADTSSNLK